MRLTSESIDEGGALFAELHPDASQQMTASLSELAPDLMDYIAGFPFGDVYQRDGMAKRERQLVTVTALATRGDAAAQLKIHLEIALALGIKKEELVEVFIQLVPYVGFPSAINGVMSLKEVLAARGDGPTS